MIYKIRLTQSALNDLYTINEYYLAQVNDRVAKRILNEIQVAVQSLKELPERGGCTRRIKDDGNNPLPTNVFFSLSNYLSY